MTVAKIVRVNGMDLKVERIRLHVRQIELAERMGVSRNRVWLIENNARLRPETAERYRNALRELAEGE